MLKLQQRSLCGKFVQNLLSDEQKEYFLNRLYNNYQIKISDKDYIILRDKFLINLEKNKHYLSTVTNGNRYFLYLTVFENRYVSLFIDRKIKEGYKHPRILLVDYKFDDSLYEHETLFSGELVRKYDNSWIFLLSNLLVYQQQKLNMNIIGKLTLIEKILLENYTEQTQKQPCDLKIKAVFNLSQYQWVKENVIPNLDYSCKAICFYPDKPNFNSFIYLFNKNSNSSKNKMTKSTSEISNVSSEASSVESIDDIKKIIEEKIEENFNNINYNFRLRNTDCPDIYQLYTKYQEKDILYGYAHIPSIKCSQYIQEELLKNDYKDIIINCKYSSNFKKWEPQIEACQDVHKQDILENLITKLNIRF